MKTNKWGKRQKRVMGVDYQKIYNKHRRDMVKQSANVKRPERLISDVETVEFLPGIRLRLSMCFFEREVLATRSSFSKRSTKTIGPTPLQRQRSLQSLIISCGKITLSQDLRCTGEVHPPSWLNLHMQMRLPGNCKLKKQEKRVKILYVY